MLKLFAVVLGGRSEGCHIELHDVVFTVSESIEQAYPTLVQKWFGNKKRLHLDCYIELTHVDGHDIIVQTEPSPTQHKLFFVNFGAYRAGYFGEIHETKFYVDTTKANVLKRAKQDLCVQGIEPHCDDNIIVDDILELAQIDRHYLQLLPSDAKELRVMPGYRRLDLVDVPEQAAN